MEPTPTQSLTSSFFQELWTKAALVLTTLIIGILTTCSDFILDKIKTGINRANTRTASFDTISKDLSAFVFSAELSEEIAAQHSTNKDYITAISTEYNTAITTLRKNEYYNYATIDKYWGTEELEQYRLAMRRVKTYDSLLHQLNPVFTQLLDNLAKKDTTAAYTPAMRLALTQQGGALRAALLQLRQQSGTALLKL